MKYLNLDSIKKWHARTKDKCIICARVVTLISAPYILVVSLVILQSQSYY